MFAGNRNRTLCDSFHDELDRTVLLFGDRFDLRRDDTALCGIHLRCIISHGLLILLRNKIYIASGVREIKILLWHAVRSVRSIVPHFGGRQVREWLQMRPIAFPFWEGGPPLCRRWMRLLGKTSSVILRMTASPAWKPWVLKRTDNRPLRAANRARRWRYRLHRPSGRPRSRTAHRPYPRRSDRRYRRLRRGNLGGGDADDIIAEACRSRVEIVMDANGMKMR